MQNKMFKKNQRKLRKSIRPTPPPLPIMCQRSIKYQAKLYLVVSCGCARDDNPEASLNKIDCLTDLSKVSES